MRALSLFFFLLIISSCSGGETLSVVLSETGYYSDANLVDGQRSGRLFRGDRVVFTGERTVVRHGRIQRNMVSCRIPGKRGVFWIPFSEILPGGLREQRLWIGYSTNAYLVHDAFPALFPGAPLQKGLRAGAGTGLIVLGKRKSWLKTHFRNRILWFLNRGFSFQRVVPRLFYRHPFAGVIRVSASGWFVPSLGEERLYSPDRLLERNGSSAWMSNRSGQGSRIHLKFVRNLRFRITVVNGYSWSAHTYSVYNRLRRCRISCGGRNRSFTLRDGYLKDQDLGIWSGKELVLKVNGVYRGSGRNRLVLQRLRIIPVAGN